MSSGRNRGATSAMILLVAVLAAINLAIAVGLARSGAGVAPIFFQSLIAVGLGMWTVGATWSLVKESRRFHN